MSAAFSLPAPMVLSSAFMVTNLPAAVQCKGQIAYVIDLFGGPGGYCESDGVSWIPRRASAVTTRQIAAGASITLQPLVDSPIQILTGTLPATATLTLAISTARAWNGCGFRMVNRLTGLGQVKLLGKLLGAAWADVSFDGSAFVITGTAGLL